MRERESDREKQTVWTKGKKRNKNVERVKKNENDRNKKRVKRNRETERVREKQTDRERDGKKEGREKKPR